MKNCDLYSILFHFGHICRWNQCAVYILYSRISTDPGLLKIRHSHRSSVCFCGNTVFNSIRDHVGVQLQESDFNFLYLFGYL